MREKERGAGEAQRMEESGRGAHGTGCRKKKKRFSAFRFYFLNIFLGLVILGIAAALIVCVFFHVRHVSVSGSTLYTDQEIEEMLLNDRYSDNTIYAVVKNMIKPRTDIPFVDKVTIRMTSYNRLHIIVREKRLIGYVPAGEGQYAYFDSQGNVIQVSPRLVEGVMEVQGAVSEDASEGEKLNLGDEQADYLVHLLSLLDKYEISPSVVTFTEQGGVVLTCGEILISLGKENNLEDKVRRLPYVLPSLEGKSGTLHLENWSEENTDIVFR